MIVVCNQKNKNIMKKLLFALLFSTTFAYSQEYEAPKDSTVITTLVGTCGNKDNNFAFSIELQNYLARFERVSLVTNVLYHGESVIDGKSRECVVIYQLTFIVGGRKKQ